MAETIELMVVDESSETRQALKKMIQSYPGVEVIGEARNGQEALQRMGLLSPNVILLGVPEEVSADIRDLEQITLKYPQVSVIVLSQHRDWHYVRQYMRAGAKDYLYMPVPPEILIKTVEEVYQLDKELHRRNTEAVLNERVTHPVRILSFVSSKGGVGKTTLAVNTAVGLALRGHKTVLLDLDLQAGIAHLLLNLKPSRTIADLTKEMNEIDPELLERYLVQHDSGLMLLGAPKRPEEMELVKPADVRVIIQSLQRRYDYIVIDLSPTLNEVMLTALELSEDIFLINTLNMGVLKNNRGLLTLLHDLNYDLNKIRLVVNRANLKNGMTLQDVSRTFQAEVFAEFNDDSGFVDASENEGIPFIQRDKFHRLTKQMLSFIEKIDTGEEQPPAAKRRRLFRRDEG